MNASRLFRWVLVGAAAGVVLSCADSTPLGVGAASHTPQADLIGSPVSDSALEASLWDQLGESVLWDGWENITLLACSPLPYDSVTQSIGPEGGVIQVGPHTLSVPAGALDSTLAITAVAPSDTVNLVQFQPQGLRFNLRATLTMSYANCDLLGSILPKRIAYVNDSLAILNVLKSRDHVDSSTVTTRLRHFSAYAIAW